MTIPPDGGIRLYIIVYILYILYYILYIFYLGMLA